MKGNIFFFLVMVPALVSLVIICPISPVAAQDFIAFSDDFEDGLDTSVWHTEVINGGRWVHATEGGNGYITALAQSPFSYADRVTDILTYEDGFDDFTFTWDMRFLNQGYHQDRRYIHFRSDDAHYPHGYWIQAAVGYPYGPTHWIHMSIRYPDESSEDLVPLTACVWSLNQWFSFKLEAIGNEFKLKYWVKGDPEPAAWMFEVTDPTSAYASGRIGFGNYWRSRTDVDNVSVTPNSIDVALDIKPGSCPNPLNVKSRGILPVAILGTEDFDIEQIDTASIRLEGIAPTHSSTQDVATPFEPFTGKDDCLLDCNDWGPDGWMDLTLKFKTQDIVSILGEDEAGGCTVLSITGNLKEEYGGTPIEGEDVVKVLNRGGSGKRSLDSRLRDRGSNLSGPQEEETPEEFQPRR